MVTFLLQKCSSGMSVTINKPNHNFQTFCSISVLDGLT